MHELARTSLLVYSIFIVIGGVLGYLKAQSKASLISGVISGALLATAYSVARRNLLQGTILGGVMTVLLCVVFLVRLRKTGKFMPAGLMLVISALELLFLTVALNFPS